MPDGHLTQLLGKYPEIVTSPAMLALLYGVPSHHQKCVLIDYDYEDPSKAVGFVMGHNFLSDYWDDNNHAYSNNLRKSSDKSEHKEHDGRLGPWRDISSELKGPCLVDLNRNFTEAWDRHTKDKLTQERKVFDDDPLRYAENNYLSQAQICLTFPRLGDYSIEALYYNAISRANYCIYIENQYFRNPRIAEAIKQRQLELAKHSSKKLYVIVITNPTGYIFAEFTRDTFRALNKFESHETPRDVVVNTASNVAEGITDSAVDAGQWIKDTVREGYADAKEGIGNLFDSIEMQQSAEQTRHSIAQDQQDRETQRLYEELMDTGARVLLAIMQASTQDTPAKYRDIYVHTKTLIVDDAFYTIGSANINIRSMHIDTEVNIAVRDNNQGNVADYRNDLWEIALDRMYGAIPLKSEAETTSSYWKEAFQEWSDALEINDKKYSSDAPLTSRILTYEKNMILPLPGFTAFD